MIAYAESSAVLAWLLGEPAGDVVRARLESAASIISSDLTIVECDRTLIRLAALGELLEVEVAALRSDLAALVDRWTLLAISVETIERARRPFPSEPIRTLDALHLAAALNARATQPGISLLSLDGRVRANGAALGFVLEPSDDELEAISTR